MASSYAIFSLPVMSSMPAITITANSTHIPRPCPYPYLSVAIGDLLYLGDIPATNILLHPAQTGRPYRILVGRFPQYTHFLLGFLSRVISIKEKLSLVTLLPYGEGLVSILKFNSHIPAIIRLKVSK